MRRTQIYLDDDQATELSRRAKTRGTTASKMIREAIDQYLAEPEDADERQARFRAAVEASFGIAPYLPDGATYVDELRARDKRRDSDLEERRET
ncbi:MAG: CopG family transcriptional regulator [Chloroflexota bacterium]